MTVRGVQQTAPGLETRAQMLLTVASGCVNAVGYLTLGGVFTSVMTANSALLGLALGSGSLAVVRLAALAIAAYLGGVALGSKAAVGFGSRRGLGVRGALAGECAVLWSVWAYWLAVAGEPGHVEQAVLLAASSLAMGCQSGGVRVSAGGAVTTAYMTGAMTGVVAEAVAHKRFKKHVALIVVLLPAGAALGGLAVRFARLAAPALPALLVSAAIFLVARSSRARKSS